MKKIYKITKPNSNGIYIGSTKETLQRRLKRHLVTKKIKPHIKVYQWLDETCIIELIEISDIKIREYEIINQYFYDDNFECMNTDIGLSILDKVAYNKIQNDKSKQYRKEYAEINKDKLNEYSKNWHRKNKNS